MSGWLTPERGRVMFDYEPTAENILAWLIEGGYSCVLEYDGKQHAYVQDEDDDYGWQRVPVAEVRKLIANGDITVWRTLWERYRTYRPAAWVATWNAQYPKEAVTA